MAQARTLDFTNVKERKFNAKNLPEGDYPAKVKSVEDTEAQSSGNKMWVFTMEITSGKGKGASYPYRCTLDTKSLWKVRNLAQACGMKVSKTKLKFDPEKLVGKECGITLVDDEYEDKIRSVIDTIIPLSEISDADTDQDEDDEDLEDVQDDDDAEEEEEKPAKKSKKAKAKKPAADEDEELEIEEM